MHHHRKLQRRVLIVVAVLAAFAILVALPLMTNDDLRYDLAMKSGQIPGNSVEKLADGPHEAQLIVLPLNNGDATSTSPWLFKAQFIAWQRGDGFELVNVETDERAHLPIVAFDFTAANADGSLVLIRGAHSETGEGISLTVEPDSMEVTQLPNADSVPETPGDWDISIWEKSGDWCNRPSPGKRFLACFVRPELSRYFAGDWQLDLHFWGDYDSLTPIFRGQGFLPIVGFSSDDTVIYFQNERGLWRANVPQSVLDEAPPATPFQIPLASPAATPQ